MTKNAESAVSYFLYKCYFVNKTRANDGHMTLLSAIDKYIQWEVILEE